MQAVHLLWENYFETCVLKGIATLSGFAAAQLCTVHKGLF